MITLVDIDGLTLQDNKEEYAKRLNLTGKPIKGVTERLVTLAGLRKGYGIMVLTGPLGAPFWSLASDEVKVRVVPDDYEYEYRTTDLNEWSYRAQCLNQSQVTALLKREAEPKAGSALSAAWSRGEWLRDRLAYAGGSAASPITSEEFTAEVVASPASQQILVDTFIRHNTTLAVDWEWDIETKEPIGVAISTDKENYWLPTWDKSRELIADLTRNGRTIWHNGKSDLQFQHPTDPIELVGTPIDDTIIMAYLSGEPDLRLKVLTRKLLKREAIDYQENFAELDVQRQARYAAAGDTRNTYDLYQYLLPILREREQLGIYEDIERPLMPVIAGMEKYGSPIDLAEVSKLHSEYYEMEEAIRSMVWGREHLDLGNDDQTKEFLSRHLGFNPQTLDRRAISKYPSTAVDTVMGYRKLRTIRRNFLAKHINRWRVDGYPKELRAYSRFNQAGSAGVDGTFKTAPRTGRLSAADPNLQNQPREIRSIYVAPEGCVLWSFDYSKLELCIAGALSGEPNLRDVIESGGDPHGEFQQYILDTTGVSIPRPIAKNANFEKLYRGGSDMLMQILALSPERLHIDYETANAISEAHKLRYPQYYQWGDEIIEAAVSQGYSTTLYGRRRYNDDLYSPDPITQANAKRAALNHAVQGTAADILKKVMVDSAATMKLHGAHLSIQVHDELVFWVPEETSEAFGKDIKELMQSYEVNGLRLQVEGGSGRTWAEAH